MNERLAQLYDEAIVLEGNGDYVAGELDPVKFAELIVKECAQVCRDQPNIYALKADRDNCAIAIEEHFGVE
jgi:hypothetical protein